MEVIPLSRLTKGESGFIESILVPEDAHLYTRLLELGFLQGLKVEVVHEAPFGKDPFAIRLRGSLVALRRHDAESIFIKKDL